MNFMEGLSSLYPYNKKALRDQIKPNSVININVNININFTFYPILTIFRVWHLTSHLRP